MIKPKIHIVLMLILFFLFHTGLGFCGQEKQSILKSIRTGEHDNFTRIVFEFKNAVQYKDPEIRDKGRFSMMFLESSTDLPPVILYETDRLQKVQSVELTRDKSDLTVAVSLTYPNFMLKAFSLSDPFRVVVDVYKLTAPEKEPVPANGSLNEDISPHVSKQGEKMEKLAASEKSVTKQTDKQTAEPMKMQTSVQEDPKPGVKENKTMIVLAPDDSTKRSTDNIIDETTKQTKEDIRRVDQKIDTQSEELMRRQRLTDRKVEDLDRKLSDLNSKSMKSEWAQRIRFGGDIRLRYQGDYYDENNALLLDPNNPDQLLNTRNDRSRTRYRVRVGMKAKIVDPRDVNVGKVEVGVRLSTGNQTNPVSTNDTLGDYLDKDGVVFDRAYLKYTYMPDEPLWGNNIPQFTAIGGRIPNPWFYTDLLWDHDLNFEGAAINFYTDTQDITKWKGFVTAGAFPLQEDSFSSSFDKWLYAGQVGLEYKPRFDVETKLGLAYYDYNNIVGEANDPSRPGQTDSSAPLFFQKGNTLFDIDPSSDIKPALASDFKLINITGQLDLGMYHPVHIVLMGDYVKNIGFDGEEVARRTGNPSVLEEDEGYQLGIMVGYPKINEFGDWNVFYTYRYLEADAVVDAFTDSDFHDGGTNAKGWILGGSMGLYRNLWLKARWLTSNEISGPPLAIDTLQMDVNARF